jgi:hypothetical protein
MVWTLGELTTFARAGLLRQHGVRQRRRELLELRRQ